MMFPIDINILLLLKGIPHPAKVLDDTFYIITTNRLMEAMTGYAVDKVASNHGELIILSNTGNNRGQFYSCVMQIGDFCSVAGYIINSYHRKISIQYNIAVLEDTNGNRCDLPPLSERVGNVFYLLDHFLQKITLMIVAEIKDPHPNNLEK